MTATAINWNHEAAKAVDYIARFRRREHHGAILWEPAGTALVFLNDGEQGQRTTPDLLPLPGGGPLGRRLECPLV